MGCIFNKNVPVSTSDCIVIRPGCCTFVSGLAYSYDETSYDKSLSAKLSKREFEQLISGVNDKLMSYMPCPTITCYGYLLALPTLGLTFLLMYLCCVKKAENKVREYCENANKSKLKPSGFELTLVIRGGTSWLELKKTVTTV